MDKGSIKNSFRFKVPKKHNDMIIEANSVQSNIFFQRQAYTQSKLVSLYCSWFKNVVNLIVRM